MPVALPLAFINLWQRFRVQKYRNQLPGKVEDNKSSLKLFYTKFGIKFF